MFNYLGIMIITNSGMGEEVAHKEERYGGIAKTVEEEHLIQRSKRVI